MKENRRIIYLVFSFLLVVGFIETIRGAVLSSLRIDFGVSYFQISNFIAISAIGYIAMTFLGGVLLDRFGHGLMARVFMLTMTLSIVALFFSKSFSTYIASNFILNMSFAGLALICNTLGPLIFTRNKVAMMNLLHFFYGLGATLGPRFAGYFLNLNFGFRFIYLLSGITVVLLLISSFSVKFPRPVSSKVTSVSYKHILKDYKFYLFVLAFGFYVSCEMGMANWYPNFLRDSFGYTEGYSAELLSLFYMIFTLGRLTAGLYIDKIGYMRVLIGFSIISITFFFVALVIGERGIMLYSASGLFFSIMYPTMMVLLCDVFIEGRERVISLVVTCSSLVSMFNNFLVGAVSDRVGVKYGFAMLGVYFFISLIFLLIIRNFKRKVIPNVTL